MPKRNRLSRKDFSSLKAMRRESGALFTLSFSALPSDARVRSACVVGKSVSPKANVRNSIKRRCREAIRRASGEVAGPFALVFHAKRAAARASFDDIVRDISALVRKVRP